MEMLCNWKAATLRHKNGDLRQSIEQNAERFGYGMEMKGLLLNTAEDDPVVTEFKADVATTASPRSVIVLEGAA